MLRISASFWFSDAELNLALEIENASTSWISHHTTPMLQQIFSHFCLLYARTGFQLPFMFSSQGQGSKACARNELTATGTTVCDEQEGNHEHRRFAKKQQRSR